MAFHEHWNSTTSSIVNGVSVKRPGDGSSISGIAEKLPRLENMANDEEGPGKRIEILSDDAEAAFTEVERNVDRLANEEISILSIFPDACPIWVRNRLLQDIANPHRLQYICDDMMEDLNYPKAEKQDPPDQPATAAAKNQQSEQLILTCEDFLEKYPDYEAHFFGVEGKLQKPESSPEYRKLALYQLMEDFPKVSTRLIEKTFQSMSSYYAPTHRTIATDLLKLENKRKAARAPHYKEPLDENISSREFLEEFWFVTNEALIKKHIEDKKSERLSRIEIARMAKELCECSICYDDEVLFEEMVSCAEGHIFCRSCVLTHVNVQIGDGKSRFLCINHPTCSAQFTTGILSSILPAKTLNAVLDRQLEDDLRGQEDQRPQELISCPFCPFVAEVLGRDERVFRCQNPDCLKESCMLCKEKSHIPLRCDEVEKDSEVAMRTAIELQMTEAMLRTCHRCQKRFFKEEGCNKMTCKCGAMMCYLCKQPILDYNHFNNNPVSNVNRQVVTAPAGKCPLWTDTKVLHQHEVQTAGMQAKENYVRNNPEVSSVKLKYDPTKLK